MPTVSSPAAAAENVHPPPPLVSSPTGSDGEKEDVVVGNDANGTTGPQSESSTASAKKKAHLSESASMKNSSGGGKLLLPLLPSVLRSVLLDLPLTLLFVLLLTSAVIRRCYRGYVTAIVDSLRRDSTDENGFYPEFNRDFTYYNRQCGPEDITTKDANDLMVRDDYTSAQAADVMMKHGAVVLRDILTQDTAIELRRYLESRHEIQDELPWHEKFFEEEDRLALGLGATDHPVISEALRQVGTHETLKTALEGIVGPDPAVVEISTMTSMHGAADQGIHTDTDFFGSSALYARTFLHSYTMFVALQDTTALMGATTLCPGTHWCLNEDMEQICLDNGAFEASSNGKTGKGEGGGVLQRGDAMMFNQNVWHRGAANDDPAHPLNRVMFILTFVSRTRRNPGDYRYQGLGTYYYQRWNQWGHTYNDLRDANSVLAQPYGALRGLGLYKPRGAEWGITWIEHFAREFANGEHFYADHELHELVRYLDTKMSWVPRWLWGKYYDRRNPGWKNFVEGTMDEVATTLVKLNGVAAGAYLVLRLVVWLLLTFLFGKKTPAASRRRGKGTGMGKGKGKGEDGGFNIPILPLTLLRNYALVSLLAFLALKYIENTELAQWATSGRVNVDPFPPFGSPASLAALESRRRSVDSSSSLHQGGKASGMAECPAGPTTVPERMDVLMGTRFDAPHLLASFDKMLEYHPGNVRFDALLDSYAALPPAATDHAVTEIVSQIRDAGGEGAGGVAPRFLLQDYATGYWIVPPQGYAEEWVRREFLMRGNDAVRRAGERLRNMRAEGRFGAMRDTAWSRNVVPDVAERWERVVFGDGKSKDGVPVKAATTLPSERGTGSVMAIEASSNLSSSLASAAKAAAAENRSAHGPARFARLYARHRAARHTTSDAVGMGDRALCLYDSDVGRWEPCRVAKVYPAAMYPSSDMDEDEALVYDNEYLYEILPASRIRPYRPLVEGDAVEALFYDDEEDSEGWFSGIIAGCHPLGTYAIKYDDGDSEEFVHFDKIRRSDSDGERAQRLRPPAPEEAEGFVVGEFVRVNRRGADGQIAGRNEDGTYSVQYDRGGMEEDVPERWIKLQP